MRTRDIPVNEDESRRSWAAVVDAPPKVLDALRAEHDSRKETTLSELMEMDDETFFEGVGAMLSDAQADWYKVPQKKICEAIGKLQRGFAMEAADMSRFFSDDMYISADFHDVLMNPDTPPSDYPDSVLFSAGHFFKALSDSLPEDFWHRREGLIDLPMRAEAVGNFTFDQCAADMTRLVCLCQSQHLARAMPILAEELRGQGCANWATIADHFGRKGRAMSNDIIARVSHELVRISVPGLAAPALGRRLVEGPL